MDTIDNDIMSKIMKRHVGGSSVESSPIKQTKAKELDDRNSVTNDTETETDWQNFEMKYPDNPGLVVQGNNEQVNSDELSKCDEIDGESGDPVKLDEMEKLKNRVFVNKRTHVTEIIETDKLHNGQLVNLNDESYKPEAEEFGVQSSTKPHIQLYTESDSNSGSNQLMLASFQSLNHCSNVEKDLIDNRQQSGELTASLDDKFATHGFSNMIKSDADDKDQSSSRYKYTVENSSSQDEDADGGLNDSVDYEEPNELNSGERDKIEEKRKILKEKSLEKESECTLISKRSEDCSRSTAKLSHCEQSTDFVNNFNQESEVKKQTIVFQPELTGDKNPKTFEDNSDKLQKTASEMKKSRKQNIPKRLLKVQNEFMKVDAFEDDVHAKQTLDDKQEGNSSDGVKIEKSRKQSKPKRLQINSENPVSTVSNYPENDSDGLLDKGYTYVIDDGVEHRKANINADNEKDKGDELQEQKRDETFHASEVNQKPDEEFVFQHFIQNMAREDQESRSLQLNMSPLYSSFPTDLNMLSKFSPGLRQGDPSSSDSFLLNEKSPESLDMIRQLREIRCNRYRKISINEKREIAGYASANGVSKAAAYYNVSKSAVSMWTKLDFSKMEEDIDKQKKNCLTGNEKFEALCQRVKLEKETKFKNMTKQDKFEVSRYAKLVGVREMSRCLDVALGTVSGWMRQYPYKVETQSSDGKMSEDSNGIVGNAKVVLENNDDAESNVSQSESFATDNFTPKSSKRKRGKTVQKSDVSVKKIKLEMDMVKDEMDSFRTVEDDNAMFILPVVNTEKGNEENSNLEMEEESGCSSAAEDSDDIGDSSQPKDELDAMIAESLQKPDVEQCYEDIRDLIKDSPLDGDDFFRELFERVIACKADKYKSLKAMEKLEVVRYAKRVGVRRIAKIMGLATGTLSGWNMKYQSCLGLTDPNLDLSSRSDSVLSILSPVSQKTSAESNSLTSNSTNALISSPFDGNEPSEVREVKLLYKERFPVMLKKIEEAKLIKFRNITIDEKIEFVKCSKLVGIRPTGRVFGIPIGTLSGWITKYSKVLHPAYNVDVDQDISNITGDASETSVSHAPITPGRNFIPPQSNLTGVAGPSCIAPHLSPYYVGVHGSAVDPVPQFQTFSPSVPSSLLYSHSTSKSTVSTDFSKQLFKHGDSFGKQSTESENQNDGYVNVESDLTVSRNEQGNSGLVNISRVDTLNTAENSVYCNSLNHSPEQEVTIKSESDDLSGPELNTKNFTDEQAKKMAQKYLKTIYQQMGIST